METKKCGLGTTAIHAGTLKNLYGTLAMPIYQTSTFIFDSAEQGGRRFAHSRLTEVIGTKADSSAAGFKTAYLVAHSYPR